MVLSVVELDGRAPLRVPLASNAWKFLHPTTVNASLQCSRIHIHRASRRAVHDAAKRRVCRVPLKPSTWRNDPLWKFALHTSSPYVCRRAQSSCINAQLGKLERASGSRTMYKDGHVVCGRDQNDGV